MVENYDPLLFIEHYKKTNETLLWKKYYRSLEEFLGREPNDELTIWVQQFGLLTNLVDDLMDKDKKRYYYLVNNTKELSICLWSVLEKIKRCIPQSNFRKFTDCIALSLLAQSDEDNYKLTPSSSENDYCYLVQRSVKLMQSFIYILDAEPSRILLQGIEYLAINFQIMNDLDNFKSTVPSDVLNKKGTLPLLRLATYAKEQKNNELMYLLTDSSYEERRESIVIIKKALNESGVLMYCRLLALSYSNRAEQLLLSISSDKKKIETLLMRNEMRD